MAGCSQDGGGRWDCGVIPDDGVSQSGVLRSDKVVGLCKVVW